MRKIALLIGNTDGIGLAATRRLLGEGWRVTGVSRSPSRLEDGGYEHHTKMARGDRKPLMMTVERAVDHLEVCIRKRPRVHTAPRAAVPLVKLRKLLMRA